MRVLVPIDDTTASEAALPEAVRLVGDGGGTIILVSVGELPETSEHGAEEFWAEERAALEGRLAEIRERLAPLRVETRVELAGDPARGILAVASEVGADRIVIATEREGVWEALAGARHVTRDLASSAPMPVRVLDMRQSDVS